MDCKGRNGYFKAAEARVWILDEGKTVNIGIAAKKSGWNSPVVIEGTAEEVRLFIREFSSRLDEALAKGITNFNLPIA
jgi:hypothetical protein